MRSFPLIAMLGLFCIAGCTAQHHVTNMTPNDVPSLLARADRGDGDAMVQLGDHYCLNEPKAARGAETVKWYKKAAANSRFDAARRGQAELGKFYLGLFEYPEIFDLKKSKPKAPCTGSVRNAANDAAAVYYLKQCAADDNYGYTCHIALAAHYYRVKNYAASYYRYATALVDMAWDRAGDGIDYKGPLLDVPQNRQSSFFDDEKAVLFRNARIAASHLTKAKISRLDARAYAGFAKMRSDEAAKYERQSRARGLNR